MISSKKLRFRSSLSAVAIALASSISSGAIAQSLATGQDEPEVAGSNEIVVTARKKEERLLDVPLSITALSADAMQKANVTSLRDIASQTPNLTLADFGAGLLAAPTIRGMSQLNTRGDNNVAVFVDGVFLPNNNSLDVSMLDLARVEIVKGPQSALYGRNSFAGTINYVTAPPSSTWTGKAYATVGSDSLYGVRGTISGPIITDILSIRVSGGYETFGGTYRDEISGVDFGGSERKTAQANVKFTPSDDVTFNIGLSYVNNEFDQQARFYPALNCAPTTPGGTNFSFLCGQLPGGKEVNAEHPKPLLGIKERGNRYESFLTYMREDVKTDFGTFSLLGGYSWTNSFPYGNLERQRGGLTFGLAPVAGLPSTVNLSVYNGNDNVDRTYSLEARYSSPQEKPVRVTGGVFYYKLKNTADTYIVVNSDPIPAGRTTTSVFANAILSPGGLPGAPARIIVTAEQKSAFGGLEFDITPEFSVTGEIRFTQENKFQNALTQVFSFSPDPDGASGLTGKFNYTDYRITAKYQFSGDAQIYASTATGNKSGGFNPTFVAADLLYGPESNRTYEVGLKSNWLNDRLTTNLSAFYIDWKDIQLTAPPTPPGLNNIIRNFGVVHIPGFELELIARPARGVTFGGSVGYVDPKLTGTKSYDLSNAAVCLRDPVCAPRVLYVDPATNEITATPIAGARRAIDLRGSPLPRQSDWTINIYADIEMPLGSGDSTWFGRVDYRMESKQFGDQSTLNFWGSRGLLGARLGARWGGIEVAVWGKNLLDDQTAQIAGFSTFLNTFASRINVVLPERRTFGLTASYKF